MACVEQPGRHAFEMPLKTNRLRLFRLCIRTIRGLMSNAVMNSCSILWSKSELDSRAAMSPFLIQKHARHARVVKT